MLSTPGRYVVRFAVHLTSTYRENYLAELAENTGADARELPDGAIAITGFRTKDDYWVRDALKQEERRGALVIEQGSS